MSLKKRDTLCCGAGFGYGQLLASQTSQFTRFHISLASLQFSLFFVSAFDTLLREAFS